MNPKKKQEEELRWIRQRPVPGLVVPEALKLRPQDSMKLKQWKYRQQIILDSETKCDYVYDHLIKIGAISNEEVEERRRKIQKLMKWKPATKGRQVSLKAMMALQSNMGDTMMEITDEDSWKDKQNKVDEQLEKYISKTKNKLEELGDPKAEVKELKDKFSYFADQESLDLATMEAADKVKDIQLPQEFQGMAEFQKFYMKEMKAINELGAPKTESVVGADELKELGLIRSHVMEELDTELAKAHEAERKAIQEYEIRFGPLPVSSDPEHALELEDAQHMEHLDYSQFETAPSQFEVDIMDQFQKDRQRLNAAKNNVTLFSRVPVPGGPSDKTTMIRALHLFRIRAIQGYLTDKKMDAGIKERFGYRDIEDLRLVMDDPEHPWKNEIFEMQKLALKNNPFWTTQQKEKYIKLLHRFLRSKYFDKKFIEESKI